MTEKLNLPSIEIAHQVSSLLMERTRLGTIADEEAILSNRYGSDLKLLNAVKKALRLIEKSQGKKIRDLDDSTTHRLVGELEQFVRARALESRKANSTLGKTLLLQLRDLQKVG